MNTTILSVAFGLATALPLLLSTEPSAAQTVVDRAIASANPCSQLKVKTLIGTIGIDNLKEAHIANANISLVSDQATFSLSGRVGCKTSDEAQFGGDATATIDVRGTVSLQDCTNPEVDVALSDFSGRYGPVLAAVSRDVAELLRQAMIAKWQKTCIELSNSGG